MVGNEGEGDKPPNPKSRKRKEDPASGGGGEESNFDYAPYFKPNYKRLYPDNSANTEYKVFVESQDKERLGNKSPIYLNHIFTTEVKGVVAIRRVNANKIAVVFKQYITANNFISNTAFLEKYKLRAHIPAAQIERVGIIRFVPTNISTKDLYTKLSSIYEIVAIRRFTKKVGQTRIPLQTLSITFLSHSLPDSVQYDLFAYRVFDYVPPLQQCYRCFKFNHSAKICNGKQRCSCCSGEHSYKDCDKPDQLCCVNCGGAHLAISRSCPVKMRKMIEKKEKITYASVADSKRYETNFPPLLDRSTDTQKQIQKSVNKTFKEPNAKKPVNKPNSLTETIEKENICTSDIKAQIIANNDVLMALVHTLVQLGNKNDDVPVTTSSIKDMLVKNLLI